jgi:hypothetical protein
MSYLGVFEQFVLPEYCAEKHWDARGYGEQFQILCLLIPCSGQAISRGKSDLHLCRFI